MRRALVIAAMAMGTWAQTAAAEAPPPASSPGGTKPRPMATTADELFPPEPAAPDAPAGPGASTRPAAAAASKLLIPPSLLIRPPGSARAPYGKGPSTVAPAGSGSARAAAAERAGYGDANSTSNFIAPTALMPPANSLAFHSYELLVLGMSYSPSSRFSMSAQALLPVDDGDEFVGLFSAKIQLVNSDNVRLALHGATIFLPDEDSSANALVGGVATFCTDAECGSHFSGYAGFGLSEADDVGVPLILSGGFVGKLGESVKLLVELDTGTVLGSNDFDGGLLAIYGLRLSGRTAAFDAGFAKPVDDDGDVPGFALGFPIVNFTIRP